MLIANFDKFNQYLDSLFAKNSVTDFASYRQALVASKSKRKAKIADISQQINQLLKQIEGARNLIKQTASLQDKKAQGQALNSFISAKKELVKQYNRQKNATLFSELTTEAKIYACAKNLLLKYLPLELGNTPYIAARQGEALGVVFCLEGKHFIFAFESKGKMTLLSAQKAVQANKYGIIGNYHWIIPTVPMFETVQKAVRQFNETANFYGGDRIDHSEYLDASMTNPCKIGVLRLAMWAPWLDE